MGKTGQSYSVAAFKDPMREGLGLSETNYSLAFSFATLISAFAMPFYGRFVDRWGARAMLPLIARVAPEPQDGPAASPLRELSALANRAVWLTLAVGAVGFGAVFAVYSYFSAALISATDAPAWAIPLGLSCFGIGATAGNYYAGRLAAWSHFGGTLVLLLGMVAAALLYAAVMGQWVAMILVVMVLGLTAGLVIPLQMRLMDVAGEGQTLAAALNHAAFNAANALGPWLAGMALAAGHGFSATGIVGAGLGAAGIAVLGLAWLDARPRRGAVIPAE